MQRQKIFFMFLILLSAASAAFFTVQMAEGVYNFLKMREKTSGRALRWEIREVKGKFPLTCYYSFEANGAVWQGRAVLPKPWHLNEMSATAALREKAKEELLVWFDPNRPEKSTLERQFPSGPLSKALLSLCILVYFIILGRSNLSMARMSIRS
jgi:hypothetical protein